jgi:nitroreductase
MKVNETIATIKRRRSIRKFKSEQINYADLQEILEAALYSPNAMNQQKWHFTVIQDKDMLERMVVKIRENMMKSGIEAFAQRAAASGYHTFYNAQTVVLISGEEKNAMAQFDCAAAAQTLALAATSLNIGSCVITSSAFLFNPDKNAELKKELGIPTGYAHVCTVALGYREGDYPEAPPRKKDVVNYLRE